MQNKSSKTGLHLCEQSSYFKFVASVTFCLKFFLLQCCISVACSFACSLVLLLAVVLAVLLAALLACFSFAACSFVLLAVLLCCRQFCFQFCFALLACSALLACLLLAFSRKLQSHDMFAKTCIARRMDIVSCLHIYACMRTYIYTISFLTLHSMTEFVVLLFFSAVA